MAKVNGIIENKIRVIFFLIFFYKFVPLNNKPFNIMKKNILFILLLGISNFVFSQELKVHHFDENGEETSVETYKLGDFIVIAHAKDGKKAHFFEGKITGLFKKKGLIKVFDYARSTRVMPLVGKKIAIDRIVGVARPDTKEMKKREHRAVASAIIGGIGLGVGGNTGDAIFYGASGANILSDFTSRNKISKQRIKCEITEY